MRKRLLKLVLLALLGVATTSAFAEPKREYYVIRDTLTKKCSVSDRLPITPSPRAVAVDPRLSFVNKTEAETGMKSMKLCMN